MMELAMQVLGAAGLGDVTPELKTDLDLQALAVDGVVPVVFQCAAMTDEGTYDVEVWLFDHRKKGVSKIIKRIPRTTSEEVRRKNRENINHALWMMYQDKLKAAM